MQTGNNALMENFDLEPYKSRTDIIHQTVQQIMKDFLMFGMEIHFTGHTEMAYNEMFSQLSRHIQFLLETDNNRLNALLYQVDLNEKLIHDSIRQHSEWSYPDIITELVIHRELKKVIFRNYYKNQKEGK